MAHTKSVFWGLFLTSFFLLFSYGLEQFAGFQPCPLCQLQRISLFCLLLFFTLNGLSKSFWLSFINALLTVLFSVIGLFLAGRQIWLQHFSAFNPNECSVSLERMLDVLPWNEVLIRILSGSSDCAETSQKILSIDLSIWSFSAFIILFFISLRGLLNKK